MRRCWQRLITRRCIWVHLKIGGLPAKWPFYFTRESNAPGEYSWKGLRTATKAAWRRPRTCIKPSATHGDRSLHPFIQVFTSIVGWRNQSWLGFVMGCAWNAWLSPLFQVEWGSCNRSDTIYLYIYIYSHSTLPFSFQSHPAQGAPASKMTMGALDTRCVGSKT